MASRDPHYPAPNSLPQSMGSMEDLVSLRRKVERLTNERAKNVQEGMAKKQQNHELIMTLKEKNGVLAQEIKGKTAQIESNSVAVKEEST